jgi:transposase
MMRFAGIDIGAERHMVAVLDEQGEVLCRSSPFGEDASGYARLFELLGPSADCLVALEATGHYWRNLFVAMIAKDYAVAVLNPLRTARFAEEELRRTKTDAIDALGIARFAQQKRPRAALLGDFDFLLPRKEPEVTHLPEVETDWIRRLADRISSCRGRVGFFLDLGFDRVRPPRHPLGRRRGP